MLRIIPSSSSDPVGSGIYFGKFLHALTVSFAELLSHVLLDYLIEHATCKTDLNLTQRRVGGEGSDAPLWGNRVPKNALKLLLGNRPYRTGIAVSGNVGVNGRIWLRTVDGNALGQADVPAGSADLDRIYTAVHSPILGIHIIIRKSAAAPVLRTEWTLPNCCHEYVIVWMMLYYKRSFNTFISFYYKLIGC